MEALDGVGNIRPRRVVHSSEHAQRMCDAAADRMRFVELHLITGAILPVLPAILQQLDKLSKGK